MNNAKHTPEPTMTHCDESRSHPGYEKLCDQLLAERDEALHAQAKLMADYSDLLVKYSEAVHKNMQFQQVIDALEVPPFLQNQAG